MSGSLRREYCQGPLTLWKQPPHGQFCLPARPDEIVGIEAKSPVAFFFAPIDFGGKFSVVKDDATGGSYRMTCAVRIDGQLAPH